MSGLAERNGGRAGLAVLAAILLLGWACGSNEAWDGRAPVFDAAAYATIAANLDRGEGFTLGTEATQPASNYSPGLPLLAAGVYKVTGRRPRTQRPASSSPCSGRSRSLFTYLIGRRLSGPVAGLVGAAAIAIYPALLEYQGMLMGEPLGGGAALRRRPGSALGDGLDDAVQMALARGAVRSAGAGAAGVPRRRRTGELGRAAEKWQTRVVANMGPGAPAARGSRA